MVQVALVPNVSHPLISVRTYALDSAAVVGIELSVSTVLFVGGVPQIGSPVIQSIAVDMVHLSLREAHDPPVHQFMVLDSIDDAHPPSRVPDAVAETRMPWEFREISEVHVIHDSDETACQEDLLHCADFTAAGR